MGVSSDRLAAKFGVSRADQDALAVASHHNAARVRHMTVLWGCVCVCC
jgi:acetyl-CoA acetyltransferase